MKLIGSYTSPFVRKISILLLEKGIEFEFVNEQPYNAENGVAQYNPLGKVPALVTDEGDYWFDSPIIAEYIELLGVAPAMLPADPKAALAMKQIEALADGIMDGDDRHRLRHWLPQFPPRLAGLVRGSSAAGQTGGDALPARKFCPD